MPFWYTPPSRIMSRTAGGSVRELPETASSMWAKVGWRTLSADGVNPTSPLDSIIQLSHKTLPSNVFLNGFFGWDSEVKLLSRVDFYSDLLKLVICHQSLVCLNCGLLYISPILLAVLYSYPRIVQSKPKYH